VPGLGSKADGIQTAYQAREILPQRLGQVMVGGANGDLHSAGAIGDFDVDSAGARAANAQLDALGRLRRQRRLIELRSRLARIGDGTFLGSTLQGCSGKPSRRLQTHHGPIELWSGTHRTRPAMTRRLFPRIRLGLDTGSDRFAGSHIVRERLGPILGQARCGFLANGVSNGRQHGRSGRRSGGFDAQLGSCNLRCLRLAGQLNTVWRRATSLALLAG